MRETKMLGGFSLNAQALSYASTTLGATMINSVFQFYYVKVFLTRYGVSESWFHTTQIIFMIWNAINDPLFGYLQDNFSFSWVKSRRHSILYGAPFFALSFLVPWFSWGVYSSGGNWLAGWHLLASLCFYDTMFTFVLLAQCALFAEMSSEHSVRVRLIQYSQIASLIGSTSVFFCELFSSNLKHFEVFQGFCILLAIVSWLFMRYTGLTASSDYETAKADVTSPSSPREVTGSIWTQTRQIMTQRNFVSFVLVNFCQIYHVMFLSNFSRIIYEYMLGPDYMPGVSKSIYYGLLSILPPLTVILGGGLVKRVGYFRLIRYGAICAILLGALLYMVGPSGPALTLFFMVDGIIASSTFSLFNLCLSDIIDEDRERYNRRLPLSSMVFGINALITKPAISVAPMVTVAYLNRHGYQAMEDIKESTPAQLLVHEEVRAAMFTIMVVTPIVVGIIQSIVWSIYRIRDSHVSEPKYVEAG